MSLSVGRSFLNVTPVVRAASHNAYSQAPSSAISARWRPASDVSSARRRASSASIRRRTSADTVGKSSTGSSGIPRILLRSPVVTQSPLVLHHVARRSRAHPTAALPPAQLAAPAIGASSAPRPAPAGALRWYRRRAVHRVLRGPFVQRLGRHVEAVGPSDGADLQVDVRLGEEGGIGEGLRHTSPVPLGEVDVADEAVLEGDAQLVLADALDRDGCNELAGKTLDSTAGERSGSVTVQVERAENLAHDDLDLHPGELGPPREL